MRLIKGIVSQNSVDGFKFKVDINSNNEDFYPGLSSSGTYNFTVDWGDGNEDTITSYNQAEATHTYVSNGEYIVTITGSLSHWQMKDGDANIHKDKYLEIISWGESGILQDMTNAFYQAFSLSTLPEDPVPDSVTTLLQSFLGCSSLLSIPSNLLDDVLSIPATGIFLTSGVTTIPDNFGQNSNVTNIFRAFDLCNALLSVGNNFFENSNIDNAERCFEARNALTTIGDNFLANCNPTSSKTVAEVFNNCSNLTTVGSGFTENSGFVDYREAFIGCSSLTALPNIVGADSVPIFTQTFDMPTTNSVSGSAQELWNDYPSATLFANCFDACTGLSNYASIPGSWK